MTWSAPLSPIDWPAHGPPRSRLFGDVYFSAGDALGESRAVFLTGCGLPERWRETDHFTVAELGFGAGRNLLALLDLWSRTARPGAQLHVFSLEAHPLAQAEAARTLEAFPELADIGRLILARWPGRARGFHRLDFPELSARVDLAVGEAEPMLEAWRGAADAWFLDGFAPARNPAMWTDALMRLVATRSAPGARAATYTAAAQPRRALCAAGFAVERVDGAGGKRHRLDARLPGARSSPPARLRVAIIGAGIAGASLARAFKALGCEAVQFDGREAAAPAPAALVAPRLDAGLADQAALFAQASRRALALYRACAGAVIAEGLIQLQKQPKDAARFAAIAGSDLFEPEAMQLLESGQASAIVGEAAPLALRIDAAATIAPGVVVDAWNRGLRRTAISALERLAGAWRGRDSGGAIAFEADAVCIAAGVGSAALIQTQGLALPLLPVRGQASLARIEGAAGWPATAFGAWAIPAPAGIFFGATHDRGETDEEPRGEDDRRNLAALAEALPQLAARLGRVPLQPWASVRATTADYLPIAGEIAGGLYALTGLGSRGFTLAPLLAEHVAAEALGAPSPLPAPLASLVRPQRFAERRARRGRSC